MIPNKKDIKKLKVKHKLSFTLLIGFAIISF